MMGEKRARGFSVIRFPEAAKRPFALGAVACVSIWLLAAPASHLHAQDRPVSLSPEIVEIFRQAAEDRGSNGLLAAVRAVIEANPTLVSQPGGAASLAASAAGVLPRAASGEVPDYGAISAAIISAAAPELRHEVTVSVTNAIVQAAIAGPILAAPVHSRSVASADSGSETAVEQERTAAAMENDAAREQADGEPARPSANKLGSFLLYPDAKLSAVYDSNIFATRNNQIDDVITVLSLYVLAESAFTKHSLKFEGYGELGRYADTTAEDYNDYGVSADGRFDFNARSNLFGGIKFDHLHESRESPDDINGIEPTTYDDLNAYAGTQFGIGRFSARLGGTYRDLNFGAVSTSQGVVTNEDRDREIFTGGAWLGYKVSRRYIAYVQGAVDVRDYKLDGGDALFDRDSDGYRVLAGARINLPDDIKAEIYAGYLRQSYDDPLLPSVDGAAFGANLTWPMTALTTLTAFVDRTVDETTLLDASARLSTAAGLAIEHILGQRARLKAQVSYSLGEYQGIDREDNVIRASTRFKYFLSRYLFLDATYRFRHLHSTVELEDYDRHQVFVGLGIQTYASNIDSQDWLARARRGLDPSVFAGAYAGMQIGYGALTTDVRGPRGPVGELVKSDSGGDGATWGLFGGYGWMVGKWYLGLEVEGEASALDWAFARGDAVRQYSVRKRLTYGGGGRAGFVFADRALLYARVGGVRTEFITKYMIGATEVDEDINRTGLRVGLGIEFPVDDWLRLRLDYTFTDYGAYEVDYVTGVDVFDSLENLVRFGFAYRL